MRDEDNMVYQCALSGDWIAVRDYLGKRILSPEVRKTLLSLPDVPPRHQTFLIERGTAYGEADRRVRSCRKPCAQPALDTAR
jgi:hypothetical protein